MLVCLGELIAASAREVIEQGWLSACKKSVWLHIWYFDKGDNSDKGDESEMAGEAPQHTLEKWQG